MMRDGNLLCQTLIPAIPQILLFGLKCVRAELMQRRTFIISMPLIRSIKKLNTCENVPPPNPFTTMEEIRYSFKVGLVYLWVSKDDSVWDDSVFRWSQAACQLFKPGLLFLH